MQKILNKIKQLKNKINQEKNEPEFLKSLRNEAFSFLEKKYFSKEEEKSLNIHLHKFLETLDVNKISSNYTAENILEITSEEGDINMNWLNFSELVEREDLFREYVFSNIDEESDFSVLMNLSLFTGGGAVVLSEEREENLLNISYKQEPPVGFVVLFLIPSGIKTKVIESNTFSENSLEFAVGMHRIFLEEYSKLEYISLNYCSNDEWLLNKQFFIESNAEVQLLSGVLGGQRVRSLEEGFLLGENAKFLHKGLYLAKENEQVRLLYNANHLSKKTESDTFIRGAVSDKAYVNFSGDLFVGHHCGSSKAELMEEGMILNHGARKRSLPILRVNTNDVEAGHGSSTSQLDEDKLFYLLSRGLDRNTAKRLVIQGFLKDVFSDCDDEAVKELVYGIVEKKFN